MSRRLAREAAMCLLFERDMTGEAGEDTLREMEDVLHTAQIEAQHESYICLLYTSRTLPLFTQRC